MSATKGYIYEYACHEGNYALPEVAAARSEARGYCQPAKQGCEII
jgi:hypothetical protein